MYIGRDRLHVCFPLHSLLLLLTHPYVISILLGVTHIHVHIRYIATFCIAAGTYASLCLILAWCAYRTICLWVEEGKGNLIADQRPGSLFFSFSLPVTHNLGSETKRAAGMPLFGSIGQAGNILGSHLYPLTEGPAYSYVTLS